MTIRTRTFATINAIKKGVPTVTLDGSFLAGNALVAYGVSQIYMPAGIICAGIMVAAASWFIRKGAQ